MCRHCTRHRINSRDPKTLMSAAEVNNQMRFLERHKSKLKNELQNLNKTIEDLQAKCPHVNTRTYDGYDDDTEVCQDCGYSW